MSDALAWLGDHARERRAAGLRRVLRPRPSEDGLVDLAGNDYLGLARDPDVVAAAAAAAATWGTGSTGSRLVTGSTELHAALEAALADFVGSPSALVFSSGYAANLGVVCALASAGDLVVSDRHVHASLVDACRLSRAEIAVVDHASPAAVAVALARPGWRRALVVTDSVFSVDGDIAPLAELHDVARAAGATLLVDDAHGLGVTGPGGRGSVAAAGLHGEPDVVVTATLSKALAAQGGVVLASQAVVDHLVDTARSFIFDTALAPPAVGAALAAVGRVAADQTLPGRALSAARRIAAAAADAGLRPTRPAAAVVSVPMDSPEDAVAAGLAMAEAGVRVGVFRPPSVPDGVSRLRMTARADLSEAELERAASGLRSL